MDQFPTSYLASIFVGSSSSSGHESHDQGSSWETNSNDRSDISDSIEPVTTREQHTSSRFPSHIERGFNTTATLISLETNGPLDGSGPRIVGQPSRPSEPGHLGDGGSRPPFVEKFSPQSSPNTHLTLPTASSDSKVYNPGKPERELQACNLIPSRSVLPSAIDTPAARSTLTGMTHHIASRYSHISTLNDCFVADVARTDLDQEGVTFDITAHCLDSLGATSGVSNAPRFCAPGSPYSAFSPDFYNHDGRIDAEPCGPEDDAKENYQEGNTVAPTLDHLLTQIDDSRSAAKEPSATTFLPCTPESRSVVGIEDGLLSSPPTSPSSSNYLPSSSPIPSSSPMGSRDDTPPTSPLNSPSKDPCIFNELMCNNDPYGASRPDHHQTLQTEPEPRTSGPGGLINLRECPHSTNGNLPQELNLTSDGASGQSPGLSDISGQLATHPAPDNLLEEDVPRALPDSERVADDFQRSHLPINSKNANTIPYPKRSTLAHQRMQQRKLAQPFRSPLVKLSAKLPIQAISPAPVAVALFVPHQKKCGSSAPPPSHPDPDTKTKHRTLRAASQFKSPLSSLDESASVRLTPTIQSLERKLQLLRRAVKVREDLQEDVLGVLVNKWTEAGREAAWEVWNLVKDNVDTTSSRSSQTDKGKKRSLQGSWGWDDMDQKRIKADDRERNWGWDVVPISGRNSEEEQASHDHEEQAENQDPREDEEMPKHDMGALLMGLGIAPETLGWDGEEGGFVDR